MAYSPPTITAAPVLNNAALIRRQDATTDPLSVLISNGIVLGNSILSELQTTATTSSTPSTSTTSSDSSSSSKTSTSASSTSSQLQSNSPTPTTTPSAAATNATPQHSNTLAIGLGVALGVLALLLFLGLLWFCLCRRRKAKKSLLDNKSETGDSWSASNRSHITSPSGGYDYDRDGPYRGINAPAPVAPIMAERSHAYPGRHEYEPMSPSSTHSLAAVYSNPFTTAHERPGPVSAPAVSEPSSWDSSEPQEPSLRPAAPAEMEGSSTTLLPQTGHHDRDQYSGKGRKGVFTGTDPSSIWPSQREANEFDFGISGRNSAEVAESSELLGDRRTTGNGLVVPRKPVAGQPTAL